ncbi:BamA/TamA family outer membrane protein [Rufibacter quisquiliarum]|uniref:Outer membrane protein assembly factor BamA n=1 Tax=Rufibacter quisquiliarum TaxID=1549639 RepID=A0A839GR65_9BACT|nr:BamA/TamA family outer membrane protein [Rufibacter quisquiliarum]MBA9077377.1 outer membrane protein assembly factor BamA [Rufibacter quisquiliarum]
MRTLVLSLFLAGSFSAAFAQIPDQPPADSLAKRQTRFNIYPVAYYTPETQFAFGTKIIHVRKPKGSYDTDRPSTFSPTLVYTTRKQILTAFTTDIWRKHNRLHFQGVVEYNDYPYFFFGVGNDTPEEAKEAYTSRTVNVSAQLERRIFDMVYLGARYEFKYETLPKVAPEGQLARQEILGSEGFTASGVGPMLLIDSRNNIFTPSRGHYHQLSVVYFPKFLGSETNFSRYKFDLRKYFSGIGPGVLAVQGMATFTHGDTPFQFLSPIGGVNVMRGLLEGRFRDEDALVAQVDYRFPLFWKIGGAVFGGAGQVNQRLDKSRFSDFHTAGGGGLRYKLNNEGMVVRGDVAFSQEGMYLYFAFSEAF